MRRRRSRIRYLGGVRRDTLRRARAAATREAGRADRGLGNRRRRLTY